MDLSRLCTHAWGGQGSFALFFAWILCYHWCKHLSPNRGGRRQGHSPPDQGRSPFIQLSRARIGCFVYKQRDWWRTGLRFRGNDSKTVNYRAWAASVNVKCAVLWGECFVMLFQWRDGWNAEQPRCFSAATPRGFDTWTGAAERSVTFLELKGFLLCFSAYPLSAPIAPGGIFSSTRSVWINHFCSLLLTKRLRS